MKKFRILMNKCFTVGKTEDNMFGSFIEHIGRAIYGGIYEPGHECADGEGWREDVIELIKELKVPSVRYPGGNFVSRYHWKEGIGNKSERPIRMDVAWSSIETNQVGTDEFMRWCKKADIAPMFTVNMGTGTPDEAAEWLEYCNVEYPTTLVKLRHENGSVEPYGIKTWFLGNEPDGSWQTCALSAEDYGKKALETAKLMKWVDPEIKLIVSGSCTSRQKTYPEWDRVVLEKTYEYVDYISIHQYYRDEGNIDDYWGASAHFDRFIKGVIATCDFVKAKLRSKKTMMLSVDEWNVYYPKKYAHGEFREAKPVLEEEFSMKDTLVFSGMFATLLSNCDRVKIACVSQLVNTISPITTKTGGGVIKRGIFYPYYYYSNYARGEVLQSKNECDVLETKYGLSDSVQSLGVWNEDRNELAVFVINYNGERSEGLLETEKFGLLRRVRHVKLTADSLEDFNDFGHEDRIKPVIDSEISLPAECFDISVEPFSWNMFLFVKDVVAPAK